jgi:cell pole-organizing protein PopZ
MSDPSDQGEPTMEEILASIRKIISEDDPEAGPEEASAESEPASGESEQVSAESEPASAEGEAPPDDVLELTERVEDEAGGTEEDEIDAILASMTGDDEMADKDTADAKPEGLVSPKTDTAVTSALSDFAGALIEQGKGQEGPVGGNQTLDALVRAALEPYLKSWLDEHLETLVERVLKEEIKRMARRAEDV